MFYRILVPVDLTEKSLAAVDLARKCADESGAEVILLHVIETIEHVEFDELKAFYERLESSSRKRLEILAESFTAKHLKVDQVVDPSGFPMRDDIPVTLEVPRAELVTAATTSLAAVSEPRSYVVKDGVPGPVGSTMTVSPTLKVGQIDITLGSSSGEVKVKAFLHDRDRDLVETIPATKLTPTGGTAITVSVPSLKSGVYDALVLVEGFRIGFLEKQTV